MICASMFNGCGVGAVAMIRANLPITKFYYSEIDKYANIVMKENFPSAIPIGDVTKVNADSFNGDNVDILMGGSPCQGFSFASKGRLNFDDPRSKLFFEYVRILKEFKQNRTHTIGTGHKQIRKKDIDDYESIKNIV